MTIKRVAFNPSSPATSSQPQRDCPSLPKAPEKAPATPKDSFQTSHVHSSSCGCGLPKLDPAQLQNVERMVDAKIAELRTNAGAFVTPGAVKPVPVSDLPAPLPGPTPTPSTDPVPTPTPAPSAETRVIDVHFHVITKGNGPKNGDVSQEMIDAQIKVLNDAYKGAGFEFRLADVDRTKNAKWYSAEPDSKAETEMKTSLRKGDQNDLNLYSASPGGGLLGWATFPADYTSNPLADGVVLLNTSLPGGTSAPYNEGDTATHEVGHWMGLYHTFNQDKGDGLGETGDSVDDTPAHAEANYGKPAETTDTLPNEPGFDPVHNYMNYVDDDWMNEFTPGQIDRMHAQWELFRADQAVPAPSPAPSPAVA